MKLFRLYYRMLDILFPGSNFYIFKLSPPWLVTFFMHFPEERNKEIRPIRLLLGLLCCASAHLLSDVRLNGRIEWFQFKLDLSSAKTPKPKEVSGPFCNPLLSPLIGSEVRKDTVLNSHVGHGTRPGSCCSAMM